MRHDVPSGTQPSMYSVIDKLRTTRVLYTERLIAENIVTEDEVDAMINKNRQDLGDSCYTAKNLDFEPRLDLFVGWKLYFGIKWADDSNISYPLIQVQEIAKKLTTISDEIVMQRQIQKIYQDRDKMTERSLTLNWVYMLRYWHLLHC